ncbi:MAG: CHRD domain-containing protein [Acidimicrobiales bacterium]
MTLRTKVGAALAAVVAGFPLMGAPAVGADEVEQKARLSGLNEISVVDGRDAAGDLAAGGTADLDVDGRRVCWKLRLDGIDAPSAAHIHKGPVGQNGPIVVDFAARLRGCVEADAAVAADLAANPAGYYVNVHTTAYPAGAVRGQLGGPEPDEVELKAKLAGRNERPGPGDADGSGVFDADVQGGRICWRFRLDGVAAPVTGVHIHRGGADAAGPIVVNFGNQLRGCRDLPVPLGVDLAANPAGYYANAHNAEFPAGAVRGQLRVL